MNHSAFLTRLLIAIIGLSVFSPAIAKTEPYPLKYWALRDVVSNVRVSPDGKYLALMQIPTSDGNPIIEVFDTNNFEKKPFKFNADPMEITSFYWVGDHDMIALACFGEEKLQAFPLGVLTTSLVLEKKIWVILHPGTLELVQLRGEILLIC